jgi:hypothetical protein
VLDEEKHHPAREQEEDELGECVRRVRVAGGVHHRRDDEECEGRPDRVPTVKTSPDRVR